MKKNKLENLEFITSLITAGLVYILCFLQYKKENKFWWLILLVAILMTANAYVKYKKTKDSIQK
ncbi:hypothetical protein [Anaerococcus sp. Marseille-P3915]|uniref:hypothetical protein n=1 Tax=Anaerococcus sp. Marseille-P3915 TaxID=2057799 RepID=UPI000D0AC7E4|nr:hypothetical protein [Anaerococcus sp. Marseille-P3915]